MLRRFAILMVSSLFVAATASIAAYGTPLHAVSSLIGWHGAPQKMSTRLQASPVDPTPTADAQHVFGQTSGAAAEARLPLQVANKVQIEAGKRADGSLCFDATMPGRAQFGSCGAAPAPTAVNGGISRVRGQDVVFAGLVGDQVAAVNLVTDLGTFPAVVKNGVEFATAPDGAQLESWTATLTDGSTESGDLSYTNQGNPLANR